MIDIAWAVVEPRWLTFYAASPGYFGLSPGEYALVYGGGQLAPPNYPPRPLIAPDQVDSLLAEEELDWLGHPLMGAELPPRGAPIDEATLAARWPLIGSGGGSPEAGTPVELLLLDDFYERSRSVEALRIVAGGYQVPYVIKPADQPIQVARIDAAVPQPISLDRPGTSYIQLDLPASNLPLAALELSAPADHFVRPVTAQLLRGPQDPEPTADPLQEPFRSDERPAEVRVLAASTVWSCPGRAILPCRLAIPIDDQVSRLTRLDVSFEDGDNAPLPSVSAVVWRRGHVLRFFWPAGDGPVQLAAGGPDLGAPSYDLQATAGDLWRRHVVIIHAKADQSSLGAAQAPWAGPGPLEIGMVWGALALAGITLIVILSRVMGQTGGEDLDPSNVDPHDEQGD